MINERRLVNLHTDDKVNIAFVELWWDPSVDGSEIFNINVCIDSTLCVHDKIP